MKLAVNARFLTQPVSGVQRYARELCSELDDVLSSGRRDDLEVTLLSPRGVERPAWPHLRHVSVGRLQGHLWEQVELPLHARRYDVLFCPANVAPMLSLRSSLPVVATVHDLAFRHHPETVSPAFRRLYEVLVPGVLERAEAVVTVSETERQAILQHFPHTSSRVVAIANGTTTPIVPPVGTTAPGPPPGVPFVLYVGALNERKNLRGVLATMRRLLEARPDLHAVVAGAQAGIYAGIDIDHTHPRLHLTGRVNDDELAVLYRTARLMLFPSFHEASGLPPVEAMGHGCPVVVSDIPALRERCGDAALYCDPYDVDSIVDCAERLLDEERLRTLLVERGRARSAELSWTRCLEQTLEVVDAVARRARR